MTALRPVLLSVLLLAAALPALGAAGPFADLDAINVKLEIGAPLDLRGSAAPELFAGDLVRFNRFKSSLEKSVGAKLEACGILWDQGAVDEVTIAVFGRREDLEEGPPHYVYMVQADVLNTELASRGSKPELVALRPVIGLADEAGLEQALIDTAVAVVAGELGSCDDQGGG
ncbi:MAG TPA: hypothetical protein VLF66_02420 [Thermoanaerobaculia bacterium]|nr:hypothetical protein [Thermoanaerobaculia bacterium]